LKTFLQTQRASNFYFLDGGNITDKSTATAIQNTKPIPFAYNTTNTPNPFFCAIILVGVQAVCHFPENRTIIKGFFF
jgi:hypothetical protein